MKNKLNHLVLTCSLLFSPLLAHSGMFEVGLSGSQKDSTISSDNFTKTVSYTGSVSYYFLEMSAIELSYTSGNHIQSIKRTGESSPTEYSSNYSYTGLDFVFSFASKKSLFQPFIKIGAAYLDKEFFQEDPGLTKQSVGKSDGTVASIGVGFRLKFSQRFSLKASYDTWSTPINSDNDVEFNDSAMRIGLSMYL